MSKPLTSYAAQEEGTKQKGVASNDIVSNYYTEVGTVTKVTAKAFAQNTTDDWTWMGMGNVVNLLYKTDCPKCHQYSGCICKCKQFCKLWHTDLR